MKQYCVISAPPDTYSGYGARARDFIKAVYELKKDEWDIQVMPQRWGSTSWGFLEDNKEECYIKIIETGDETLINDLERFITLRDDIKRIEAQKQEYVDIVTKLQNLVDKNDEQAVNSIVEEYLRK